MNSCTEFEIMLNFSVYNFSIGRCPILVAADKENPMAQITTLTLNQYPTNLKTSCKSSLLSCIHVLWTSTLPTSKLHVSLLFFPWTSTLPTSKLHVSLLFFPWTSTLPTSKLHVSLLFCHVFMSSTCSNLVVRHATCRIWNLTKQAMNN